MYLKSVLIELEDKDEEIKAQALRIDELEVALEEKNEEAELLKKMLKGFCKVCSKYEQKIAGLELELREFYEEDY